MSKRSAPEEEKRSKRKVAEGAEPEKQVLIKEQIQAMQADLATEWDFGEEGDELEGDEGDEEEGKYSLMTFRHNGADTTIKEIGMNKGVVRITPENNNPAIEGIGSHGFASCIAIVVKSKDNKYISLEHTSQASLDDLEKIGSNIEYEKNNILQQGNNLEIDVVIGFCMSAYKDDLDEERARGDKYLTQKQYDNNIRDKESFLKTCHDQFDADIIDLPNSTIFINKLGEIDTSIELDTMDKTRFPSEEDKSLEIAPPSASPSQTTEESASTLTTKAPVGRVTGG